MSECPAKSHGTVSAYYSGCRCDDARAARARTEKRARYDRAHGKFRRTTALGTQRRIRALWAIGWPSALIGERLGWCEEQVTGVMRNKYVYSTTAANVSAVYEQLSGRSGPSSQTRGRAVRAGYAPPLAWDDIDDADEEPAVPRSMAGRKGSSGSPRRWDEDLWDDVAWLRSFGTPDDVIADRMGIEPESLKKAERRRARVTPAA